METMFTLKYAIFLAIELTVVATVAVVLIGGVYQLVRNKFRSTREHKVSKSSQIS